MFFLFFPSLAISGLIHLCDFLCELAESGVRILLELGLGRMLSRLCTDAQPLASTRSVADFRSTHAHWLRRKLEEEAPAAMRLLGSIQTR
ncbi:hypothetical protein UB46_36685 [Burkholderiaceae bacterium 16]|nr:hypothetical protein UB46_36685 [Burkholderiaceae bacterium 16]